MPNNEIVLPAALVIRDVRSYFAFCKEAITAGAQRMTAGALVQVDTSGLQLLLAMVNDLRARGVQPAWTEVTAALHEAAFATGLVSALALPSRS